MSICQINVCWSNAYLSRQPCENNIFVAGSPSRFNSQSYPSQTPLTNAEFSNYVKKQIMQAEILHGTPLNNEYELIPFNHFTYSRVYPSDLGLGKRVVEKPIGYKRKDLLEALSKGLDTLNRNVTDKVKRYTLDDFLEGMYRIEPTTGTQFELYFKSRGTNKTGNSVEHGGLGGFTKIVVVRPFAPLQTVISEGLAGKVYA